MDDGAKPRAARIPSLDGMRTVAVALTVVAHLEGTGIPVDASVLRFFSLGNLGVRIFFVISGFLITGLLLDELERTDRISLKRFYFRRSFRIFPPYYFFLGLLFLLSMAEHVRLHPGDMLHALTYTDNYNTRTHSSYVAHTWSLAVEEQFYLLWPAVIVLLGRVRALWGAALFLALAPVIRVGIWYLVPEWRGGLGTRFETVGDALATGCLLAGLRPALHAWRPYRTVIESRWMVIAPLAVLAVAALDRPRIQAAAGVTIANLGIALALDRCMLRPEGFAGRFLNWRPIAYIGTISYSLYLWQSLFMNRFSPNAIARFPVNLVLLPLAALASYYLIERPSLRLRARLDGTFLARRRGARPDSVT